MSVTKGSMNSSISTRCHPSPVAAAETASTVVSSTKINRRHFLLATAGLPLALPKVGFAGGAEKSPNRSFCRDRGMHDGLFNPPTEFSRQGGDRDSISQRRRDEFVGTTAPSPVLPQALNDRP